MLILDLQIIHTGRKETLPGCLYGGLPHPNSSEGEDAMKDFADFRDNWLTPEKESELKQTNELRTDNEHSFMATFSATYSLLLLAEYHNWLNSESQP